MKHFWMKLDHPGEMYTVQTAPYCDYPVRLTVTDMSGDIAEVYFTRAQVKALRKILKEVLDD